MEEEKYKKVLTIILAVIIIAIVGLLGYFVYDYINAFITSKNASEFVDEYEKDIPLTIVKSENNEENSGEEENNSNNDTNVSGSKKTSNYLGTDLTVLGTISIPRTNCKYAVFQEQTQYALNRGVSMLYGVGLNQPGNTVIIGHNYRNGQFFSNNKRLDVGDKIYITDYNGTKLSYTIYEIFQATPEDASFYTRNTNGDIEITLSTCTDDNKERLIILARAD